MTDARADFEALTREKVEAAPIPPRHEHFFPLMTMRCDCGKSAKAFIAEQGVNLR